jgi:hypothetical protein
MHITTQKAYIAWIEMVIDDPFSSLPPFCDWLDEYNISSQQWREILSLLDKVLFYRKSKNKMKKWKFIPQDVEIKFPSGETKIQRKPVRTQVDVNIHQSLQMITKQNSIHIVLSGKNYSILVSIRDRSNNITDKVLKRDKSMIAVTRN